MINWPKEFNILDFGYSEEEIPLSLNHYNEWVSENNHLPLTYLSDHRKDLRQNIKNFYPDFESSLTFLFSYQQSKNILDDFYENSKEWNGLKLASYTLGYDGLDYHEDLSLKLESIGEFVRTQYGADYRLALDIHPILDRDLAYRSGLGWYGKNSMLINKKHGSFFIIGSILLNKKINIETKKLDTDHCGQCTRCIDACPTDAIDPQTRTIKTKQCISTFTIEEFKLDTRAHEKMTLESGYIFGCDICQDVCPWNKRVKKLSKGLVLELGEKQNEIISFFLKRPIHELKKSLEELSNKGYQTLFHKTSFSRSGKRGILKNIIFYLEKNRKN